MKWLGILELNQVHEFQRLGYKPIYQSPITRHVSIQIKNLCMIAVCVLKQQRDFNPQAGAVEPLLWLLIRLSTFFQKSDTEVSVVAHVD